MKSNTIKKMKILIDTSVWLECRIDEELKNIVQELIGKEAIRRFVHA